MADEKKLCRELCYTVPDSGANKRACDFLRRDMGYSYSSIVRMRHEPASLLLNGEPIRTIDRLRPGAVLTVRLFDRAGFETPRADLAVPIVYEDDDIIVFDKPAGIACHTAKGHPDDTLANFYAAHCPGSRFRILGRLDKDTSGLVLAAKNARSAQALTDSHIDKEYLALLCAVPFPLEGTIDAPIEDRDPELRRRFVCETGRPSVTNYRVLRENGGRCLVLAKPETGRTHQLRVHFSYVGSPLAGDELYGGDSEAICRQALHRSRLSFIHPVTGQALDLTSPMPVDMMAACTFYGL